jgi:SAM-dependent methyltransferase
MRIVAGSFKVENRKDKSMWPKQIPVLSKNQQRIQDDWQQYWLDYSAKKYSGLIDFGHKYVVKHSPKEFIRTLDVGAGLGEHLHYECLNRKQTLGYHALEYRSGIAKILCKHWPGIKVIVGDCQCRLPFQSGFFDRILAIHVAEHLNNLPAFFKEVVRLVNPKSGKFLVVLPSEGGWAYNLARQLTSKRLFQKRYGIPYEPLIRSEHINTLPEIMDEIKKYFIIEHCQWWPVRIPFWKVNFCLGLCLRPKKDRLVVGERHR